MNRFALLTSVMLSLSFLAGPGLALAHCDSLDGPVVADARAALSKGEATPVLKWVRPEDEKTILEAFRRALAVRAAGPEARDLADTWFFETLVRIHRAGEGAPFTGLKPAGSIDPFIASADRALEAGAAEELTQEVSRRAAAGIRQRFARAVAARARAEESVALGRAYVEAYVDFIHYVEALGLAAEGAAAHHEE